jgi:2-succinyl-5-enolpyruvyl-6-hydroxy-3-cyclohexene-1-carboxylate synthase
LDEPAAPGRETLGNLNLRSAAALIGGLVEGGAKRAVISPGSRSSPLALAADLCPALQTEVLPDERCAAFFALGQARAENRPVIVIATSGTAPANWYPALIEASMDGVPLVLISADRPEELRQTGANQTVDQDRMFGAYPREYYRLPAPPGPGLEFYASSGRRAADRSLWPRPGPVHVNAAFREPLMPDPDEKAPEWKSADSPVRQRPRIVPDPQTTDWLEQSVSAGPGVIVCGRSDYSPDFAARLTDLADRLRCPIIADPLSNLRWGPHRRDRIMTAADLFLRRSAGGPRADWVLQFGAVPTSRPVQDWIGEQGDRLIPVVQAGDWPDLSRHSRIAVHGDPGSVVQGLLERNISEGDEAWCQYWSALDEAARSLLDEPDLRPPEANLVDAIETRLPADTSLFVGSSMPIRAFDAFATGRTERLTAFGNRGASGIDGCVSTVAGLGSCGPTLGVIGDLALYHDMNGLLAAAGTDTRLVVIENGGGAIFGLLPPGQHPRFERLWRTPTRLACERIAGLYSLPYRLVRESEPLEDIASLPDPGQGLQLVEFRIDAETSWTRHRNLWQAAAGI